MDKKSRIYYGYIIMAASAIIMMMGWGTHYSYGVFFEPLMTEFGWTRALTSGAFSLSTLGAGLVGIIAGRVSDRFGPKVLSIFCGIAFSLGFMLMSLVNSVWQVYLLYGILMATGIGGMWSPLVSTVARWFIQKRGLMTGIVASGIGFGTLFFPPLISYLVSVYGWRTAYFIIGVIVIVTILIASRFLKRDPTQSGLSAYGEKSASSNLLQNAREFSYRAAFRTRQFWTIGVMYFLFGFNQTTVMVHVVPYATGQGISPITASGILAVIGATSIFGRIIIGGLSDRTRSKPSLILVLITLTLSLSWLVFADNLWALYLFGVGFGFAWGGLSALQSLVTAELFGLSALGILVGNFSFAFCFGGLVGPIITGHIFDVSGSYKTAFIMLAISGLMALLSILWLTPPKKPLDK